MIIFFCPKYHGEFSQQKNVHEPFPPVDVFHLFTTLLFLHDHILQAKKQVALHVSKPFFVTVV